MTWIAEVCVRQNSCLLNNKYGIKLLEQYYIMTKHLNAAKLKLSLFCAVEICSRGAGLGQD